MRIRTKPVFVVLALLLAFCFCMGAPALEMSQADLRVVVHESAGRFSLYSADDEGKETALFLDRDPRTTILSILVNDKTYAMGDSFEFRQIAAKTEEGLAISWTSSRIIVEQRFAFAQTSEGGSPYLKVSVSLRNIAEGNLKVGMRYLFDTYLGERSIPFTTSNGPVSGESEALSPMPAYLSSASKDGVGFYILANGDGLTTPSRIVFANWKRLNDGPWDYAVRTSRNFNLLPYSINDSAVALYYPTQTLAPGETKTVHLLMGSGQPVARSVASRPATATSETAAGQAAQATTTTGELAIIDDVLQRIDTLLRSPDTVTAAQVDEIRSLVKQLIDRKSGSEQQ